ncbi:hypothetical protein BDW68DRAFT_182741 [Aspergillus falconensis]
MGPLVGGAISLALNVNTAHVGKVTYTTYLGLVAVSSLAYLTVRSRALASFLTAVVGAAANLTTGIILELKYLLRETRSKAVYIITLVFATASWTWNAVVQTKLSRMAEPPAFGLGDGPFFNSAFTTRM